jgi:uncharacterized protein
VIPEALQARLQKDGSLTLTVKVIPKSSRNEVVGLLDNGSLKLKITAAPEKGKANAAICEFLAAEFDVPKRNVQIIRGETASTKQIVITSAAAPSQYRR